MSTKNLTHGFTLIELMIVVAIVGILAAIALPQYENYIARAQITEAFSLIDGLKTEMAGAYAQDGSWIVPTGSITSGKYVLSITTSNVSANGGDLIAAFKPDASAKVRNQSVTFRYTNGGPIPWGCVASTLPIELKPKIC